jgi:hypothetical protein
MVPRRPSPSFLVAALLALGGASVHAESYVCTTANGRTVTADRLPPECADRPVRVLNNDGSLRILIEPPPTAEQRAARDAEAKRKIEEEEEKQAQRRRDKSLLETYSSEAEIEAARTRALGDRQVLIERAMKRLEELKRERKKLDDETEFYNKRDMPEKLKRGLAANNETVRLQEKTIADTKADMARVNERYDGYVRRFRELVKAGAQPVQRLLEPK